MFLSCPQNTLQVGGRVFNILPVGESVKVEVEVTAMEVVRGTKLYHFNVSTIDFYSSVHLFSLARTRVHVAKAHLYNYCSPLNNPVKGE